MCLRTSTTTPARTPPSMGVAISWVGIGLALLLGLVVLVVFALLALNLLAAGRSRG